MVILYQPTAAWMSTSPAIDRLSRGVKFGPFVRLNAPHKNFLPLSHTTSIQGDYLALGFNQSQLTGVWVLHPVVCLPPPAGSWIVLHRSSTSSKGSISRWPESGGHWLIVPLWWPKHGQKMWWMLQRSLCRKHDGAQVEGFGQSRV